VDSEHQSDKATLRDQFAMAALSIVSAELINQSLRPTDLDSIEKWPKMIAEDSYKMADAMMEARVPK
jgi:hypothetical protein